MAHWFVLVIGYHLTNYHRSKITNSQTEAADESEVMNIALFYPLLCPSKKRLRQLPQGISLWAKRLQRCDGLVG